MGGGLLSWHKDLVLLDEEEGLAFAVCGFGYFSLSSLGFCLVSYVNHLFLAIASLFLSHFDRRRWEIS